MQANKKSENSVTKTDMNALLDCVRGYDSFSLFQDEAGCEESNFFYLGYLLVKDTYQKEILNDLIAEKGTKYKDSEITFKRIRKDDYKAKIALEWLNFADICLQSGKIRFYVLGVNKNNLKNFWKNSWSFEKNIYLRFLEIGINSLTNWFSRDSKLMGPFQISNVFFEYGNYNDEREKKLKWLENLSFCDSYNHVYSNPKKQKVENNRLYEITNLIQLTDLLLGVSKYSFVEVKEKHVGRKKCVACFLDIIEKFCNEKMAYNTRSEYYKRFAIQFFPTINDITKEEFLSQEIYALAKRGGFYCDRLTYRQHIRKDSVPNLFEL